MRPGFWLLRVANVPQLRNELTELSNTLEIRLNLGWLRMPTALDPPTVARAVAHPVGPDEVDERGVQDRPLKVIWIILCALCDLCGSLVFMVQSFFTTEGTE
jgi:hypothetical protein